MSVNIKFPTIFNNPSVTRFFSVRLLAAVAFQILSFAIAKQIYDLTGQAFYIGMVGLAQFLPMFALTFVVGHVADRYNRKFIVAICQIVESFGLFSLAAGSYFGWLTKESMLFIIFLIGVAHAFEGPPMQAFLPNLVPPEVFPKAAAIAASVFQTGIIGGPVLGGFLYILGPTITYTVAGILFIIASLLILSISLKQVSIKKEPVSLQTIFAGLRFIWSKPVVLGAISLDLFAVLFGGATALLPAFADVVLHVGTVELGILRAAPAIGAVLMSLYLARSPLKKHVGRKMFNAVLIFGVATVIFALSRSYALSLGALIILGAADVISVVVRSSLVQMETPDEMRGRVSAVNLLFIGTSNQLGEFESGVTAAWFGLVLAAVIGGIGTIFVVLVWMKLFPQLVAIDSLEKQS